MSMDELVEDLAFALEESDLIVEVQQRASRGKRFHRRRLRKGCQTVSASGNSDNFLHANQMLVTSLSDTDGYRNSVKNFSGSDTESGFVLPSVRRHRRKKIRHMEIDGGKDRIAKKSEKNRRSNINFMTDDNCDKQRKEKNGEESSISTSDESNDDPDGQDGDDEMTDFYNEPGGGPVSGIPCIAWWEQDNNEDARLRSIITGAFPYMSDKAKRGFHARINRLPGMAARSIRKGRRRYRLRKSSEKSSTILDFPRQENKNYKRRKTENFEDAVEVTSSTHLPIPETNTGHQMLVSMGWKPGEGLGAHGQGIQDPILTTVRKKRSGFGL